jgi:hypothetical protein
MKKKKIISSLFLFVVIVVMTFLKVMLTGDYRHFAIAPISFNETLEELPLMLLGSFLAVLIINYMGRKK